MPSRLHRRAVARERLDANRQRPLGSGRAGWAAVFAGGLKTLELPSTVRAVIIAADNDASGVGQRSALAAYDRWTAEGRSVRIKTPPAVGTDFNDLLFAARVR